MKRVILLLALAAAAGAAAMDWSDPRDPVYSRLDLWAARGYVTRLPLLRPYPAQLIVSLLREVGRKGDPASAREAGEMLAEANGGARFGLEAVSETRATQEKVYSADGGYATLRGSLSGLGELGGLITLSSRLGAVVVVEPGNDDAFVPGERFPVDYMVDYSVIRAKGLTFLPALSAAGSAAIGTDRVWFQAGVNRHSFGPFDEGPVLSPQAQQTGELSFTWRGDALTYTDFVLMLTATSDRGDALGPDGGISQYPNKYLAGQSFQFSPVSWLDVGLFETVVYGERFEPLYLVPVVSRTYTSINTGSIDNLFLGFSVSGRLPSSLGFDFMFYADDLHFLDILKLNLDTKYKVSGQAGVSWTPLGALLKQISLDYALVTPYTYTHRRSSITGTEDAAPLYANGINYYNYTHAGRSLVALDPNSDRLRLHALLTPAERLDVTLSASYQRHGNATGSPYLDTWAVGTSDGGINDNGYIVGGTDLFSTVSFLTQDVIEQILLVGASASYRLPLRPGALYLQGGYTLEVARNKRDTDPALPAGNAAVPIEGNDIVLHHLTLGLRYAY